MENFVDSSTQGTIFCKTYFLNSLNHDFEEGYKFIGFNGANSPKLEDIKHSLLSEEKLFFNILSKNSEIIDLYKSSINTISDFYLFFHNFKFYFNLIINNQTEQEVVENFPKYLFKHKKAFIIIYKKINSEKKNKLSNLFFKTESLVRKNNNQFESIGLRFLLNFKKIVTAF